MCLCERLMIDHPDPQTLYSLASSPIELAIIRAGTEAFLKGAKDEGTSGTGAILGRNDRERLSPVFN